MKIEIRHGELLERELELAPRTYTIGRSNKCDIVLVDKRLSRKHASLIVSENSWQIEDLGSANGVFVNGKRVKKKKNLSAESQVTLGHFTLSAARLEKVLKSKKKEFQPIRYFFNVAGNLPYISASAIIAVCCLMSVSWIGIINRSYLSSIVDENELNKAWSITDNLVYHNLKNWGQSDLSKFDIDFYEKSQGVEHIYLVDQHGRVLAPLDKVNSTIKHPLVVRSLKRGKPEWENIDFGKMLLCKPVLKNDAVVGGAIIHFQMTESLSLLRDRFFQFTGGLFLLLLCAIGASILLVKIIMQPWVRMGNALEKAVLYDGTKLDFKPAYEELDNVTVQLDRVLLKCERAGSPVKEQIITKNNNAEKNASSPVCSRADSGDVAESAAVLQQTAIACLIDSQTNQLVEKTDEFAELFDLEEGTGQHIIEAFKDTSVLADIMDLIQSKDTSKEIITGNGVFLGSKEIFDNSPGHILLSFTRKDNQNGTGS